MWTVIAKAALVGGKTLAEWLGVRKPSK